MIDPTDAVTRALPQATRVRFASETRFYNVVLDQDLLGDWTVVQSWGGREGRRGGGKVTHVASFDAGMAMLQEIARLRVRNGFQLLG